MSADLIGAIDRAVLELPEDLQVIWMRFRPHVTEIGTASSLLIKAGLVRPETGVRIYTWNSNAIKADIYHPSTNSPQGWSSVHVEGLPLKVARTITEFFQEKTQQRCATEEEAV